MSRAVLSKKEEKVLELFDKGEDFQEIADLTGISRPLVELLLVKERNIYRKPEGE